MAAGGAAWRGEGADPGRGGGKVLGEVGILAEKAGRQDTHPAEKTFPGDLPAQRRKDSVFRYIFLTTIPASLHMFSARRGHYLPCEGQGGPVHQAHNPLRLLPPGCRDQPDL